MSTQTRLTVHDGHSGLFGQLNELDQWWPDPRQKVVAGVNIHEVHSRLEALRFSLLEHFSAEECGGLLPPDYHGDIRFVEQSDRLLREHGELLGELSSILKSIPLMDGSAAQWQVARQAFDRFAEKLRTHEDAEACLLSAAYEEESGTVD